jgi:nucleoside-diphosphate-sugar epimerase
MTSSRRVVLLTGSTGVIDSKLLTALRVRYDVVALVHRRRPEGSQVCVQADLTAEGLGLSGVQYRDLAARVDVVVHCAALTAFAPSDLASFDEVNAGGTRRILQLAEAARAPVVLLSSAMAVVEVCAATPHPQPKGLSPSS